MEISVTMDSTVAIVAVKGSVDGLTADQLLAALSDQVKTGNTRLVADCSGLDYTSSAGLRALLGSVKQARNQGGDLRLAAVQPQVLRVLDLAGFTGILKLYGDVPAAVASFG